MSAAPHLLHRLRRWWRLKLLQIRAEQLAGLIRDIEASMENDAAVHATSLFELRAVNAHLAAAQQQLGRRSTAW